MHRLKLLTLALAVLALTGVGHADTRGSATLPLVKVYKSPTCGCCAKWVEHLKAAGFEVEIHEQPNLASFKEEKGVPPAARSCHTALVGGYVVEGHVPADLVLKMLKEHPKIVGIATPGMPVGSPGMEQGERKDAYDVVSFAKDGQTAVYAKR